MSQDEHKKVEDGHGKRQDEASCRHDAKNEGCLKRANKYVSTASVFWGGGVDIVGEGLLSAFGQMHPTFSLRQ